MREAVRPRPSLTLRAALVGVCAAAVAGCSFAPPYTPPPSTPVTAFKEQGRFTVATPDDTLPRGAWWEVYGDPTLNGLETRIATSNPTLAGALAAYNQATAFLAQASAALGPRIGTSGFTTGNRQSNDRPLRGSNQPNEYMANSLSGAVDYELDLWGRVRNLVASGADQAQASAADIAGLKLSLQGQLAESYLQLRGLDAQLSLLRNTVDAYGRAYALVDRRHRGGVSSGLELSRSATQLASARAQVSDTAAARALVEHAIASLVGDPASNFTLAESTRTPPVVVVPTGLPSTLLQRRPDVAAAERRVAAANAQIGVARAAFYPAITLNASGGFQSTERTSFFTPGDTLWSFGPSAALTLFDNGRRRAVEAAAFAARDAAAAQYRARVLVAFQEVEDALSQLNQLGAETIDQEAAVRAASRTEALSLIRYQQGATTLLDVVVAQTAALQARQAALNLSTRRLTASVRLIRAIGGGWSTDDLPAIRAATPQPAAPA